MTATADAVLAALSAAREECESLGGTFEQWRSPEMGERSRCDFQREGMEDE